jgi:DNA (cytosine-5)-methyltransferase 1
MSLLRFLDRVRDPTVSEEPSPMLVVGKDEVVLQVAVSEFAKNPTKPPIIKSGHKLRALDVFCGAGGAARGLMQAGFHVTGVDIEDQPNYCGDCFIKADALDYLATADLSQFDYIHASPPCKFFTELKHSFKIKKHDIDLIAPTRPLLVASGRPWTIENVMKARKALRNPVTLCATMFPGLETSTHELRRHRLFETSFPLGPIPPCRHSKPTGGVYGGHGRDRRRPKAGAPNPEHRSGSNLSREDQFTLMGIPLGTMTLDELSQAIPPIYAKFIAEQWLRQTVMAPETAVETVPEPITVKPPIQPPLVTPKAAQRMAAKASAVSVITLAPETSVRTRACPRASGDAPGRRRRGRLLRGPRRSRSADPRDDRRRQPSPGRARPRNDRHPAGAAAVRGPQRETGCRARRRARCRKGPQGGSEGAGEGHAA